jgi:antitoxin YefM
MITAIKERATVKENGTVEISALDLPVGTAVEVIVLVEEEEMDTTEYLLSTEANREHLMKALEEMNHPENFIRFDSIDDLENSWKK